MYDFLLLRPRRLTTAPVIMAGLGRALQQKQEALHGTGRDPSHSVKVGPPRRSPAQFRSHQQGVEGSWPGGGGNPPLLCSCTSVCVSQRQKVAHLLLCNIITHKREIPGQTHICSQYEAESELGSPCEKFPIYGGFGGVPITSPS